MHVRTISCPGSVLEQLRHSKYSLRHATRAVETDLIITHNTNRRPAEVIPPAGVITPRGPCVSTTLRPPDERWFLAQFAPYRKQYEI